MKLKLPLYEKNYHFKTYKLKHIKKSLFELGQLKEPNLKDNIHSLFGSLTETYSDLDIELDHYEKLYILLLLKSKIDDNEITINYTCGNCKMSTESKVFIDKSINIDNTDLDVSLIDSDDVVSLKHAESLEDLLSEDYLDNMSIRDYNFLNRMLKYIPPKLKFEGECNCLICGAKNPYKFTTDQLFDIILPITFVELYKYEVYMKLRGYSLKEVMNMYPYELEMYRDITDDYLTPKS